MKHRPADVVHAHRQRVEPGHQEARLHQPPPAGTNFAGFLAFFLAMDAMTSYYFTHVGHRAGPLPPLYVRFNWPACSPETEPFQAADRNVAGRLRLRNHERDQLVSLRFA